MWKMLQDPEVTIVTPQMAEKFATMPVVYDRPIHKQRIAYYTNLIRTEKFRTVYWSTCFCRETGIEYRVNGQHTAAVIRNYVTENGQLPRIRVIIERYVADTLQDVSDLWNTFDTKIAARTRGDANGSYAHLDPELVKLPKSVYAILVSGLSQVECGYDKGLLKRDSERASMPLKHREFSIWYANLVLNASGRNHVRRAPVCAIAYMTFQKDRIAANAFWKEVRDETGLSPLCPSRVLAKFLSTTTLHGPLHGAPSKEMMQKCVQAWNAWRQGKPSCQLRFNAKNTSYDIV